MNKALHYLGQGLSYLLFIAFIGYFSHAPSYTNIPPDQALIKLTFDHTSKRLEPCRKLTAQQMAKLPRQLRFNMKCPRERSPLHVEFEVDGNVTYQAKIEPRGLSHDLPAPVYQRFTIPAGRHHFRIRMDDDVHHKGFDYFGEKTLTLAPLQTLVIDFNDTRNEFVFE